MARYYPHYFSSFVYHRPGNLCSNMTDANKQKLQLRSGLSTNGDKSPSPATKLLINHGKPNFTIPRSHKTQNGNANTNTTWPTPTPAKASSFLGNNTSNNNEFVVKSTMFNGAFKPSNISAAAKQTLPQNGKNAVSRNGSSDNEVAKVVLRRPQAAQIEMREREDEENVPEFIRRQRRIQERLANQNILDFENRRSGYFTQVMISPTNPNRQSFVETMASPAVKPGLEMPTSAANHESVGNEQVSLKEQNSDEQPQLQQEQHQDVEVENGVETGSLEPVNVNGQVEEEEVAKAIEEVNKAIEGEDDDKSEVEDHNKEQDSLQENKEVECIAAAAVTAFKVEEEPQPKQHETPPEENVAEEPEAACVLKNTSEQNPLESGRDEGTNASVTVFAKKEEENKSNGHAEQIHHENGILKTEQSGTGVTILHVNGINVPSIPAPDPSGEKGVNYETKTVVSFSQELGNGDNKYPDLVKVVQDNGVPVAEGELKELTKMKFEIMTDSNQDIEVKPVLVNEAV